MSSHLTNSVPRGDAAAAAHTSAVVSSGGLELFNANDQCAGAAVSSARGYCAACGKSSTACICGSAKPGELPQLRALLTPEGKLAARAALDARYGTRWVGAGEGASFSNLAFAIENYAPKDAWGRIVFNGPRPSLNDPRRTNLALTGQPLTTEDLERIAKCEVSNGR